MNTRVILECAFSKLYASKGQPKYLADKDDIIDAKYMIDCAEMNAQWGYGAMTLKKVNECARQYVKSFGKEGEQFCDLLGNIGWALCTEDKDAINKAWTKLSEWTCTNQL